MTELKIETKVTTPDGKKFSTVADAEAYLAGQKFMAKINSWMDAKGMPSGKGSRRKSVAAIIAQWEADKEAPEVAEEPAEEPTL